MKITIKTFVLFTLLLLVQISFGQTNKEKANSLAKEAVKLEDEQGKYDEAIKLLEEAHKLDPDNIDYSYELAYSYTAKKDHKKASDILEKLLKHKDAYAIIYQALGNSYDYQGMPDKAIATYEKGLKKFPNSGELYVEMGHMKYVRKDYLSALAFYEKGIEVAPQYPTNYYWASKIFLNSDEEVWGMIYGEIFMNIQNFNDRTSEISKLLYDTYKSQIIYTSDTSASISFSKNSSIDVNELNNSQKIKIPFSIGIYEPLLSLAAIAEKSIDLNSLDRIRSRFIEGYFQGDHPENYPNILFDYQLKVKNAGHFEAYNHWLLMKGDEDGFEKWLNENKTKWDNFVDWYNNNVMRVDNTHKFYRKQY